MPWFEKIIPETVKKSVCAYLLQRYLGQFFEEKLTRDQLSVDLYNGTGSVEKVSLDVQVLNELGEEQNWPLEFVHGFIEKLYISVPWSSLLKEGSFVEVNGLKLTVQPKQRTENATSMFESMWNSMSSSMKLAEECAKQDAYNSSELGQPYEGLELFANTIDSILSRVKVNFVNTTIQIEHVPSDSTTGVGLVIHIDLIEYSDEAGKDPVQEEITELTSEDTSKAYFVSTFTSKNFKIEGLSLSTLEFYHDFQVLTKSMMETCDDEEMHSIISAIDTSLHLKETEQVETDKQNASKVTKHVIPFCKFSKMQEIKIHLKQSEKVSGPKVSIEFDLGSLTIFLSPRQLHALLELANGIASPKGDNRSRPSQKSKCAEKPMTPTDFDRIEQELQQQLKPLYFSTAGFHTGHGWSAPQFEESDGEDNFLPMKNVASGLYDSVISGASSSMDSSLSSSMISSFTDQSTKGRRRVNRIDMDPTAEISHFQIRIASLALVLLHEDILNLTTSEEPKLVESSVMQMQATAEKFFKNLGSSIYTLYGSKDFELITAGLEKACLLSHLRLIAAPLSFEADEKTTSSAFSINGSVTAAKLELSECLYENGLLEVISLMKYDNNSEETVGTAVNAKPAFKLSFKHNENGKMGMRRVSIPKTDLSIFINNCTIEFDVTIIDRITALLNPHPICTVDKKLRHPYNFDGTGQSSNKSDSCYDIKISSPCLAFKIRFPISDFRPAHDLNKTPWWKRSVRFDSLILKFADMRFQTTIQSGQTCKEYSLDSPCVDLFYSENENSMPVHLAKAGRLDETRLSSMQEVLQDPCIKVKIVSEKKSELEERPAQDPMTMSIFCASITPKEDGPFSSTRCVHESTTPHERSDKEETKEMIIPGDKEEIESFMLDTMENAKVQINVTLPTISLQMQSKHLYELIYNRINNDLLLWEPSAPKPKKHFSQSYDYTYAGFPTEAHDVFATCRSGVQYESDSGSDEGSEEDGAILFYSTTDRLRKSQSSVFPNQILPEVEKQSNFALHFHIGSGKLSLITPVRDTTSKNVVPSRNGELQLNIENGNVFVVGGFKGDKDLGYVCVQVNNAILFHCDMMSSPTHKIPLKEFNSPCAEHLNPTIFRSEKGALTCAKNSGGNREMFTVAIKIQSKHETHHVKTIQVAIGLNKATLRHKMCTEPNSWISQIIDFFNVPDYPIPGYNSKEVITELHLHLWDCAIDYRPLYLPLRSAVTLGTFSMSSHLSEKSNTSTLRFISEDCCLFISEKAPSRNGIPSSVPLDLKRDFVNVIEIGLFELSLRTNDKNSGMNPHIDLRASNDIIHIHTCSDTGRSLTQLIGYVATDGDLNPAEKIAHSDSAYSSPRHTSGTEDLIGIEPPQGLSQLSVSQHQQVNDLLGEAIQESLVVAETTNYVASPGAKLFFFPDEKQAYIDSGKPLPQVTHDLGEITLVQSPDSNSDEDFFMVDMVPGLGMFPKDGIAEIKWLTTDLVRVVENHFCVPAGKNDLLKAPKSFPVPVMKYTLCEMNLVWHMYGGNDFKSVNGEKEKKTVNFSDIGVNDRVTYQNRPDGGVIFTKSFKDEQSLSWQVKGGINRNQKVLMELQLNKVKFQHEKYPEDALQASRQVLLVSELEIRDRLASSQFNKFLYQYTSQARPKQSRANMVVVKAIHIRPDPKVDAEECCLRISMLPLRLNVDQDSLLFLSNFFSELGGQPAKQEDDKVPVSKQITPTHPPPVMTVSVKESQMMQEAQKVVDDNLLILLEESKMEVKSERKASLTSSNTSNRPIYFRNVLFSPDVLIRLDYMGKRVDVRDNSFAGLLMGLLMGLGQLNCSELRLRRISHRHGLLGFEKLITFLLQEWLNDIKKNQLPSLLGGVGPIHSLVQLFQGMKDLVCMPIEQYQKDGRIFRGLQRGANSFTTSTAMAALELTSRLIHFIQFTAETAYDMLSPGPSVRRLAKHKGKRKRYYHQPQDLREGMANALMVVKEGIGETAGNIVQVASHEHEQKGYSGAVGGVLRQIPPTIIKPIIIASEATNNVLGGMRSQLEPDARREANQKWRREDL